MFNGYEVWWILVLFSFFFQHIEYNSGFWTIYFIIIFNFWL